MKWSALVSIAVVLVVVAIWVALFRSSDKHPEMLPMLAGCYASGSGASNQKMTVTESGVLVFGNQRATVAPYEDKQSISLLPSLKVVAGQDGRVQFKTGNPLLLRFDADKQGFVVPSEDGESIQFRKVPC